jgi:hypothetical protein
MSVTLYANSLRKEAHPCAPGKLRTCPFDPETISNHGDEVGEKMVPRNRFPLPISIRASALIALLRSPPEGPIPETTQAVRDASSFGHLPKCADAPDLNCRESRRCHQNRKRNRHRFGIKSEESIPPLEIVSRYSFRVGESLFGAMLGAWNSPGPSQMTPKCHLEKGMSFWPTLRCAMGFLTSRWFC